MEAEITIPVEIIGSLQQVFGEKLWFLSLPCMLSKVRDRVNTRLEELGVDYPMFIILVNGKNSSLIHKRGEDYALMETDLLQLIPVHLAG
jgi:hypothetical protein